MKVGGKTGATLTPLWLDDRVKGEGWQYGTLLYHVGLQTGTGINKNATHWHGQDMKPDIPTDPIIIKKVISGAVIMLSCNGNSSSGTGKARLTPVTLYLAIRQETKFANHSLVLRNVCVSLCNVPVEKLRYIAGLEEITT